LSIYINVNEMSIGNVILRPSSAFNTFPEQVP